MQYINFLVLMAILVTLYSYLPKETQPNVVHVTYLAKPNLPPAQDIIYETNNTLRIDEPSNSKQHINFTLETEYKLPKGLLSAVHYKETSGNCKAKSSAGAIGCFQFRLITIKDIKQRFSYSFDPYNYAESAKAAAMKLSYLANRIQSNYNTNYEITWSLTLAAYNSGYSTVANQGWAKTAAGWATSYRGVANIIDYPETSNYVRSISKELFKS
jgi:hypothetical protein